MITVFQIFFSLQVKTRKSLETKKGFTEGRENIPFCCWHMYPCICAWMVVVPWLWRRDGGEWIIGSSGVINVCDWKTIKLNYNYWFYITFKKKLFLTFDPPPPLSLKFRVFLRIYKTFVPRPKIKISYPIPKITKYIYLNHLIKIKLLHC